MVQPDANTGSVSAVLSFLRHNHIGHLHEGLESIKSVLKVGNRVRASDTGSGNDGGRTGDLVQDVTTRAGLVGSPGRGRGGEENDGGGKLHLGLAWEKIKNFGSRSNSNTSSAILTSGGQTMFCCSPSFRRSTAQRSAAISTFYLASILDVAVKLWRRQTLAPPMLRGWS